MNYTIRSFLEAADIMRAKTTLDERLLNRAIGDHPARKTKVQDFYGDRAWIDDLDIVNELGGHTGCVNALRYAIYPLV